MPKPTSSLVAEAEADIASLTAIIESASEDKRHGEATRAIEVRRTARLDLHRLTMLAACEVTDPVERAEARERLAMETGNWTAATKYSKEATEARARRDEQEAERRRQELDNATPAQLFDQLVMSFGAIPRHEARDLLLALADRLGIEVTAGEA